MMSLRRPSPERSLAAAWEAAPGCRDPRTFLAASWNALEEEERRRIERHVADCPACSAERKLARVFDDGEEAARTRDADVDWIVARLERARSDRGRSTARHRVRGWRWAAAAALFVGAAGGYLALRQGPPPLPAPPEGPAVLRGADLVIVSPAGDLARAPRELRFAAVEGAARYRVRLLDVGDDVLWEESVPGSPAPIPGAVRDGMRESVSYRFQVEALDRTGARLAASGQTSFRVVPRPPER